MHHQDAYQFVIEHSQVRRFREAAWDTDPGRHASDDVVPPTFLGAAASIAGRAHTLTAMEFDVSRAFHGTEVIEVLAPVQIGDVFEVRESVEALPLVRGRRGGVMRSGVRRSDFTGRTGDVVATTRRVILETQDVLSTAGPATGSRPVDDGLLLPSDPVASVAVSPDVLTVGTPLEATAFGPLTVADFVRYAAASGDLTAIHFDELAATERGYPAPFAMGMLSAAFIGHAITGWVELVVPWRLSIRFSDLVWPGETLTVTGVASRLAGDLTIEATCSAGGERVVTSARLDVGGSWLNPR